LPETRKLESHNIIEMHTQPYRNQHWLNVSLFLNQTYHSNE